MKLGDLFQDLKELWSELSKDVTGLIGLGILVVSVLAAVLQPFLLPFPEAAVRWRDISYWQDNPPSAPPAWTNLFLSRKAAVTLRLKDPQIQAEQSRGSAKVRNYRFAYDYSYDQPPTEVIFHCKASGPGVIVTLSVERPDGKAIELVRTYTQDTPTADIRIPIGSCARCAVRDFLESLGNGDALQDLGSTSVDPASVIFSRATGDMLTNPEPLRGKYAFVANIMTISDESRVDSPCFVITGKVSGVLGTDSSKRDLFSGIVSGLVWALLIGLVTAFVSGIIGVLYGIFSAYYSGSIDSALQFVYQIVSSIPALPLMLVISAIYKPDIWMLIALMILLSWTGPVMTVRSMAMQIKEETYVEAARALGASNRRIIFRHIFPILIPYAFTVIALAVPGAILYESSISLLGLGDATIVTWGQILHDAFNGGAILNGIWWWALPPGIMIAVIGMSFTFLGFSLDKILHPKLKNR